MHIFHLGVSRMSKDAATEHLRSTTHTTYQYKNVQRTMRTIFILRTVILLQVNTFVDEIFKYSNGTQVGLSIRNTERRPGLNGFFTDDALDGMLEVVGIKTLCDRNGRNHW